MKQVIVEQREKYIKALNDFYLRKNAKEDFKEVLCASIDDEQIYVFRLIRHDYAEPENGKLKITDLLFNEITEIQSTFYNYGELEIELTPFNWNDCVFLLEPRPNNSEWLIEWIKNWIDEDEKNKKDENGLSEVIHHVTNPESNTTNYLFKIDFGSSNVNVFFDLLDKIKLLGTKRVKIG